jgi:RNA polymerase sigma-70 factor (sigma-E family)
MDVGVTDPAERSGQEAGELSFDAWVEDRVVALLRFAYLVTGSRHAAEDAVQAALTNACERWSRVRRTTDPDAYVRRMVVNAHVSAWRRSGRRELAVAEVRGSRHADDPAEALARDDAVWRVCHGLPRQQRAAVVLRYYEDLEYDEIAAVLGCTAGTARSHVHRALAALRAELESQEAGDD